jgi:hypothetical protein
VIAGVFALIAGGLLIGALVLVVLATTQRPGGIPMTVFRRNRLLAGLACFAAATAVAIIGYLKISIEPDLNRQIPYLASAGMALVILVVLGGALIVGEQLRSDAARIEELEHAVSTLAAQVAPAVERPARRRRSST